MKKLFLITALVISAFQLSSAQNFIIEYRATAGYVASAPDELDDAYGLVFSGGLSYKTQVTNNIYLGGGAAYSFASGRDIENSSGTVIGTAPDLQHVLVSGIFDYRITHEDPYFIFSTELGYAIATGGDENLGGGVFIEPKFELSDGSLRYSVGYRQLFLDENIGILSLGIGVMMY